MEKNEEYRYDLKQIMTSEEIRDSGFKDLKRVIHYRTYTDGYTKILSFDEKNHQTEEKEVENHTPELMINIELGGIGVSIICDGNKTNMSERREIIFCSFTDIQGICIDFKTERRLQLRLGRLQIDNQFLIDTPYPVTLFSNSSKIEQTEEDMKPFFNLSLVISKDIPDVTYFKKVEFLIQKLVLK